MCIHKTKHKDTYSCCYGSFIFVSEYFNRSSHIRYMYMQIRPLKQINIKCEILGPSIIVLIKAVQDLPYIKKAHLYQAN